MLPFPTLTLTLLSTWLEQVRILLSGKSNISLVIRLVALK